MSKNTTILGISTGHNGAVALVKNGDLIYYLEEERLTRFKRDSFPIRGIIEAANKEKIDILVIGGTKDDNENHITPWRANNIYENIIQKINPKNGPIKVIDFTSNHHAAHASNAFYNSGFKDATVIVVDGAGSKIKRECSIFGDYNAWESETIFSVSYPSNLKMLWQHTPSNNPNSNNDIGVGICKVYEAITTRLNWHPLEAGKVMGLSPYGKNNPLIPKFYIDGVADKNIFQPFYPSHAGILTHHLPQSKGEFHLDPNKLTELEADMAYQVQKESEEQVFSLIEKALSLNNSNNICITGGFGLNCVANYKIKKNFPKINLYNDPICFDGGIAIGTAKFVWHNEFSDPTIRKNKSIYLGPKYSEEQLIKSIQSYNNMFNVYDIKPENVAKLISENNIVTIFQGRSEAGPRALGNRSILYNPADPNGKDFVNKVKKREWFRPFAGTVLLEKANEWFDMAGLEESPFMMYAMDVWPDKQDQIKAITHVDGTCRIQTVTEEQNPHYYKLIQEFEKITGVPILFNTSFNLAGDPLVETIEDALETMLKSEMKYMYVPELGYLLEKKG